MSSIRRILEFCWGAQTSENITATKSSAKEEKSESKITFYEKLPMGEAILVHAKKLGYNESNHIELKSDGMYVKKDFRGIIQDPKYTIIAHPTFAGQLLLADFYKRKYDITIIVLPSGTLPYEEIRRLRSSDSIKVGFVYSTHSHATPIIYEKKADKEHVYEFDSLGGDQVFSNIPLEFQNIKLFISREKIQGDGSSCYNYAFFILKEALRMGNLQSLIRDVAEEKPFFSFSLPERIIRSAQVSSALNSTDPNKIVKSSGETLQAHRTRYTAQVAVKEFAVSTKKFVPRTEVCTINFFMMNYGQQNRIRIAKEFIDQQSSGKFRKK